MGEHNQQNKEVTTSNPAEENSAPETVEMSPRQEIEPFIEIINLIHGGMHQVFEY
ncbi:MAG: hypothetical protein JO251_09810 [Verrucomicrobia bacterium]|nr:hypothetical protein [Verrucomicrobiota bacterium]MBV8641184.1 hypothetical protein [Verrucomicrobiota bacterium]